MELTQEYFDKGLENLGKRLDDLVTKDVLTEKLDKQTKELQAYVHQAFETQQTYMEERFKEVTEMLDVRKEVESLKKDMEKLKGVLKDNNLKVSWES